MRGPNVDVCSCFDPMVWSATVCWAPSTCCTYSRNQQTKPLLCRGSQRWPQTDGSSGHGATVRAGWSSVAEAGGLSIRASWGCWQLQWRLGPEGEAPGHSGGGLVAGGAPGRAHTCREEGGSWPARRDVGPGPKRKQAWGHHGLELACQGKLGGRGDTEKRPSCGCELKHVPMGSAGGLRERKVQQGL